MKTLATAFFAATLLVSCVPSTPQARIQMKPQMYEGLSAKHRALVERGEITRGMSQDAVYLAWGSPSNTLLGSYKGQNSERWDYMASRPIYTTNFYGGYGYGYGGYRGYRGYRYSGVGLGFGPEIAYVPSHIATVWFLNRSVDSWERRK